jgi:3-oxoacyl-[acyl-carrier-protein] synthase-3
MPGLIEETLNRMFIKPGDVDHFFPHQPSAKTLDFLLDQLHKRWPDWRAVEHRNIEQMGNTSGACTGWLISRAKHAGQLKTGQLCLVASFGAGMSYGLCAFRAA